MGESVLNLDERTDPATRQILQNVIKRKQKYDQLKQKHLFVMSITLFLLFCYMVYLYYVVVGPYSYSFARMFSAFVDHKLNLLFLILTVGSYGLMNLFRNKRDKAEKEFHALRCEIIDKSKDLWRKEEAWSNRHLVFEMMKKNYDINLFHEKK
ncbi:YpbF family protein [Bacillus marasmi]|uniref:YpbF family protein n=1 Tax=Bacillus marasmi TaxID=1926279 RepID=UPI0011CB9122|nr:YpbF family protein [Bacillus marasmi]